MLNQAVFSEISRFQRKLRWGDLNIRLKPPGREFYRNRHERAERDKPPLAYRLPARSRLCIVYLPHRKNTTWGLSTKNGNNPVGFTVRSVNLNKSACGRVAGSSWSASCIGIEGECEINKNSHLSPRGARWVFVAKSERDGMAGRFGRMGVLPNNHHYACRSCAVKCADCDPPVHLNRNMKILAIVILSWK